MDHNNNIYIYNTPKICDGLITLLNLFPPYYLLHDTFVKMQIKIYHVHIRRLSREKKGIFINIIFNLIPLHSNLLNIVTRVSNTTKYKVPNYDLHIILFVPKIVVIHNLTSSS